MARYTKCLFLVLVLPLLFALLPPLWRHIADTRRHSQNAATHGGFGFPSFVLPSSSRKQDKHRQCALFLFFISFFWGGWTGLPIGLCLLVAQSYCLIGVAGRV